MPVETVLRCDAPGDDDLGEYVTITVDGLSYDVILCPRHRAEITTVAAWGQRVEGMGIRRGKRGTDPDRLERLFRAE